MMMKWNGKAWVEERAGDLELSRRTILTLAGGASLALLLPRLPAMAAADASAQADLDAYNQYLRSTKGILDIRTFHRSGQKPGFLEVVVVSAGFTPSQMGDFHAACERFTKALLSSQPWKRYLPLVNIMAVFVGDESVESTKLHAIGYNGGAMGCDQGLAVEYGRYAANSVATVVIHNSSNSRGGTGTWGVSAFNKACASIPMVSLHELGHGLAGAGDEYIQINKPFDGDPKSLAPTINVTLEPNPKLCKWHYWTEQQWPGLFVPSELPEHTKVGNFEGAGWISGIYRPEEGCLMRGNRNEFCVVCNEAMETNFFRDIDLFQVVEPAAQEIDLWNGEHVDVHLSATDMLHQPPEWLKSRLNLYLDGDQVASSDRGEVLFRFAAATSQPGKHQIGANLNIQSQTVRRDFGFLSGNRGWCVNVIPLAKPALTLPPDVFINSDDVLDLPVKVAHQNPSLFELKVANSPEGGVLDAGRFKWKPSGATGSWRVDFIVSYQGRPALIQHVRVHVTPKAKDAAAPDVQPLDPIDVVTGTPVKIVLKAAAKDNAHLLFETVDVPANVEIDPSTGEISWVPLASQAGPLRMQFRVRNGRATSDINLLLRVRRASTASPVSFVNRYIPHTLEALKQVQQSPAIYCRLFETLRLLRDRYEPIWHNALADAKELRKDLTPKLYNNGLEDLHLHAWEWADKPDILGWIREFAADEKSDTARLLLARLDEIDAYNRKRMA